ncbi:MAG: WXG100 family type VII secretion target [Aggregatilineales bacterium]
MGAPKIQADYDGLSEIAKHFAAKAQDTNNLIQTVQRCVDELQRGAWIGKGASQFYAEMQNLVSPSMQRLRNALDDASSATSRIAQALQQHEREAGMLFSGADGGGAGVVGAAVGAALGAAGAGGVLGGVQNFFRDLIQGGRDARDGFIKAVNKALGTGLGMAFDKLIAPRLVDRAINSSLLSKAGISNFIRNGSDAFKKVLGGVGGGVLVAR